jgi:hypothetical protein
MTVYQDWKYRIPGFRLGAALLGRSVRPAKGDLSQGEIKWITDILQRVGDRRKLQGKGLEEERTECGECR